MATTRFADHILKGTTAARPAATAVPAGTIYASSTDGVIYQSDGTSWGTWLAAPGGGGGGALTLLSTTTLASPGTIDVSALNQTYNDLVLMIIARGTRSAAADNLQLLLNNDSTAANYDYTTYQAFSSTITGNATAAALPVISTALPASTAPANYFGVFEITIPGYASTTWLKQVFAIYTAFWGNANNNMYTGGAGFLWRSTAAVTRVTVSGGLVANLATGSQVRIYGRL